MSYPSLARRPFDPLRKEWMDADPPLSDALRTTLDNLRRLNAWFGAYQLAETLLLPWVRGRHPLRWLDLACGLADLPVHLLDRLPHGPHGVTVTAVDFQAATLALAQQHAGKRPIRFQQADILHYEPDDEYDIVTCFLALHHFSNDDACRLLGRMRGWRIPLVVLADLERTPAATVGIQLLTTLLMRDPETVHDARLSIRQAFSHRELADLAVLAGWSGFSHTRHPLFRQAIVLGG